MSDTSLESAKGAGQDSSEAGQPLTNHRYGGHSGVNDDHQKLQYDQAMPTHLDNSPAPPYSPCGTTEPVGIEEHGMYGTAPRQSPLPPPLTASTRPRPGPASLGQYDNDEIRPVAPLGDIQQREVLDECLAQWVDPGTVKATLADGVCELSGQVRDAETRARIEQAARTCLPSSEIRNQLTIPA